MINSIVYRTALSDTNRSEHASSFTSASKKYRSTFKWRILELQIKLTVV
jgi:hypothetical protein